MNQRTDRTLDGWTNGWTNGRPMFLSSMDAINTSESDDFQSDFAFFWMDGPAEQPTDQWSVGWTFPSYRDAIAVSRKMS